MTAIVTGLPLTGKVVLLILWLRTKCSIRFLSNLNLAQKKGKEVMWGHLNLPVLAPGK